MKVRFVKEQKLADLKEKSQHLDLLENKHATLLARSRLVAERSDRKFAPVILMDEISRSVNPLNLWLHRVVVSGQDVEIEGRGLKSHDIRKFVDTLEQTALWKTLLAIETQPEVFQGSQVYHIRLRFTMDG